MIKIHHWLVAVALLFVFFIIPVPSCSAENWEYMLTNNGVSVYVDSDSFWYNKRAQQAEADMYASIEDGRHGRGKMHLDFNQWSVTFNFRMYYANGRFEKSYRQTIYTKDIPELHREMRVIKEELDRHY